MSSTMDVAERKLWISSIICLVFMIIEIIGGLWAGSLAIMTDAAHLFSDLSSFAISIFAIWVSKRNGSQSHSFGYYRAEILGAMSSVLMIWLLTGFLCYKAAMRLIRPEPVDGFIMFVTAVFGLFANIMMMSILGVRGHDHDHDHDDHEHNHEQRVTPQEVEGGLKGDVLSQPLLHDTCCSHKKHGNDEIDVNIEKSNNADNCSERGHHHGNSHNNIYHDHKHGHENLNLQAAYIHALGDLIQNIGVAFAAALIYYDPKWTFFDPICTFLFSILVIFTTVSIMREAINVLMEGTPIGIETDKLRGDLSRITGVEEVHDLHVWSLTLSKPTLAAHLVVVDNANYDDILHKATAICQNKYMILHTTIQIDHMSGKGSCLTQAHEKCFAG